jgi:hypothetical protein
MLIVVVGRGCLESGGQPFIFWSRDAQIERLYSMSYKL